ncbi:MAG: cobyrinate a,c-diamide synthase [Candidatus Vecturithrix sp.]|nr:cobyrinate a,c-diamide synthase [Candidatus Vecturithrix sp.]
MNTLMIAAPASGSGKTTVTMGILRALKQRGLDVCAYKTGPDYIDRAFLEAASGKPAGNLDLHLQGEAGLKYALAQANGEWCVIEGAMGYFDGIYNTYEGSSYDIARLLNISTVLVYTPQAEMFSIVPKLKGMAEFQDSTMRAVIFNNVTPQYYDLIKEAVEEYTNLKVLGFVSRMEEVTLPDRHLGLVQQQEIENLDDKITRIANALEECVDIPALLRLMETGCIQKPALILDMIQPRNITVAIAKDRAFSFYYRENLELFEHTCRQVVYFSPIDDPGLPPCDLLYLGGGYPEIFRTELTQNEAMMKSIRAYIEQGGYVYAECGGFMYLTESIDDVLMVGVFKGKTHFTPRLQRFGYIDITLKEDCLIGQRGDRLTGQEFHTSVTNIKEMAIYHITKTRGTKTWECGYQYKHVLAGYPHLNFLGNVKAFQTLLTNVERRR